MVARTICYQNQVWGSLQLIAEQLVQPGLTFQEAIGSNSLEIFQALPNRRGWQGRVGLWGSLSHSVADYRTRPLRVAT